jgi:hypothetical protein
MLRYCRVTQEEKFARVEALGGLQLSRFVSKLHITSNKSAQRVTLLF